MSWKIPAIKEIDTELFLESGESLIKAFAYESLQLMLFLYPVHKITFVWVSGRSLSNSVINLGIQDQYAEALSQLGFEFEVLAEQVLLTFNPMFCIFPLLLLHYYLRAFKMSYVYPLMYIYDCMKIS